MALPVLFACGILSAQKAVDLNSLAAAADHYVAGGLQGQHNPPALDLQMIRGDNGGHPEYLMVRAADVQRWTLFYNATYKEALDEDATVVKPKSASVKCTRGLFSDFFMSAPPIPDTKSMNHAWLAVSLDAAIAQLNVFGYIRGFSDVTTKRPDNKLISDELVYVFTCPWERTKVAISANNGAMVWYQMY